jgi:hypothetical protein
MQLFEVFHINGLHPAVERKDDGESHGHLGSGHGNDEQGKNLTAEQIRRLRRFQKSRKGNKVEAGTIQHKLNTHKNTNCVPPGKHGEHAQTEKE